VTAHASPRFGFRRYVSRTIQAYPMVVWATPITSAAVSVPLTMSLAPAHTAASRHATPTPVSSSHTAVDGRRSRRGAGGGFIRVASAAVSAMAMSACVCNCTGSP
jgi:hypothetical protein